MKVYIHVFFENLLSKFNFHYSLTTITGTDFHESLYPRIFRKSVEQIQVSLQSNNNNRPALYMQTDIHF
jgi:hypothetical protein